MKSIFEQKKTKPLKFIHSVLLILVAVSFVRSQSKSEEPKKEEPKKDELSKTGCRKDLLQSYSLAGIDIPIIEKIEMCPTIVRSCCLKQDQVVIYHNFIQGGELQRIVNYYTKVKSIYEDVLESLMKTQDFANAVKKNSVKTLSNCKLLAERVLSYELSQVEKLVDKNIQRLVDFFKTSYSAFYCTICNFDMHKYFDLKSKKVFFSDKFCRDIVKETLHILLLFHFDIVKLANLVTKFVASCNYAGTFNLDAVVPKELNFEVEKELVHDLVGCRDHRNRREWFTYCKDICTKFEINSFSKFFQPNLEKLAATSAFINKTLLRHANSLKTKSYVDALASPAQVSKLRILQETDSSKDKSKSDSTGKGKRSKKSK